MPKISVMLQAVHCVETEDATTDEIYVIAGIGTVLSDSAGKPQKVKFSDNRMPKRKTVVAPPGSNDPDMINQPTHPMTDNTVWPVDELILEEEVGYGHVNVGIWLMDQDASEDVSAEDLAAVNDAISAAGVALAPATRGVSLPVSMLARFFLTIGVHLSWLDGDDVLGMEITPLFLQPPNPEMPFIAQQWVSPLFKKLVATEDGAEYYVYYFIKVEL